MTVFSRFFKIVALSILLVAAVLTISWLIDNKIEITTISYQTLTNTVTIICSIVLLVIGLTLFRKFSGDQSVIDKQTEVVVNFICRIATLGFSYHRIAKGKPVTGAVFNVDIFNYKDRREFALQKMFGEDLELEKQYLGDSYLGVSQILRDFAVRPYMPVDLAKKAMANASKVMCTTDNKDPDLPDKYILMHAMRFCPNNIDNVSIIPFYGASNSALKIENVMDDLRKLHDQAEVWLKKNNPDAHKTLNIKNPGVYLNY